MQPHSEAQCGPHPSCHQEQQQIQLTALVGHRELDQPRTQHWAMDCGKWSMCIYCSCASHAALRSAVHLCTFAKLKEEASRQLGSDAL
jgi:hypothetical protein